MNYFDPYPLISDRTTVSLQGSKCKKSATAQWIEKAKLEHGGDFIPRFATRYEQLRQLPRRSRRSLQRQLARSNQFNSLAAAQTSRHVPRTLQRKLAWSLAGAALLLALGQGLGAAATISVTTKIPGIEPDGQCSLIEAIVNANDDAATHGDCIAGSGPDTILLPKGIRRLTDVDNSTYGPTGLPVITSPITIQGNGVRIRRQGSAPEFRLVAVSPSGDLTLQNLTLSGGSSLHGGTLLGFGGGALNYGSLTIESSTISGNTAEFGGGVFNFGSLTIQNSTIAKNTASSGFFGGGGVANLFGGVATIQDSTISNNSASRGGGAVNCGCSLYLSYAILTLNRSLIAGNRATVAPEVENFSVVTADNFNLFGANGDARVSGFTTGLSDIVPAPGVRIRNILGPLRNNGGPTKTHALKPGSPALDAVPLLDPDCVGTDQRGVTRPQGNGCDIGAFERDGP